jgi:ubiquinone/menaquinone biosynthesis C-methylase UbiE
MGLMDYLDYQHQLYTAVLSGKLYLSPIGNNPRNVLDVGTGTGIWAIEFGRLIAMSGPLIDWGHAKVSEYEKKQRRKG